MVPKALGDKAEISDRSRVDRLIFVIKESGESHTQKKGLAMRKAFANSTSSVLN